MTRRTTDAQRTSVWEKFPRLHNNQFGIMRFISFLIICGIAVSAWLAFEFLGGLAEDQTGKIKREFAERLAIIEPQATSGNIIAQYQLARLYDTADIIVANPVIAAQWMEKAARSGHVKAQYHYATMLEQGRGLSKDLSGAVLWYERAARNGNDADAQYMLGRLFGSGIGVGYDDAQATKWYLSAALGGQPAAQYMAGRMFETGWGVRSDPIKAYMWYSLANRRREEVIAIVYRNDPQKALDRLDGILNKSQRVAALQMAADWHKQ